MGKEAAIGASEPGARALSEFQDEVLARGWPEDMVAVDLSLGGWRARQAATELAAQVDQTLDDTEPYQAQSLFDSPASIVGAGIDAEARGRREVLIAYQDACRLAPLLAHRCVAVFAPRFGLPWRPENSWFFRFARQLQPTLQLQFVTDHDATPDDVLPKAWLSSAGGSPVPEPEGAPEPWSLWPGLIPGEAAAALASAGRLDHTYALAGNLLLVDPSRRVDPRVVARDLFDRMASQIGDAPSARAYFIYRGNNLFVDALQLAEHAWAEFANGGMDIALDWLDRAVLCSKTPIEKAVCQSQAQGMRIALGRYREAAAIPDPASSLPDHLRQFLRQTKGWGMVMSNDAAGADGYLQPLIAAVPESPEDIEQLYLLNIYALVCVRRGDDDAALALEQRIRRAHEGLEFPDARLGYVNALNTARLYRRRGETGDALRLFREAFATTEGVRTEAELIYMNVVLAGCQDGEDAARCWLRAALHWVSAQVPEALLGLRLLTALGCYPLPEDKDGVDVVSDALARRLPQSDSIEHIDAPAFQRLAAAPGNADECRAVVGGEGWGVVLSSRPVRQRLPSTGHRRLRALLWNRICSEVPADSLHAVSAVFIDDRYGRELPTSVAGLMESALRTGCRLVVHDGRVVSLSADQHQRLQSQAVIGMGPAVAQLRLTEPDPQVEYRRYLPARSLSADEVGVLNAWRPEMTYGELADGAADHVIESLFHDGILVPKLTESICIEAGISLPTNVN